ncbi:hypothetical protein [Serratia fonticola]
MRTDLEYLKGLTAVFLNSPNPYITTDDLDDAGFDITSPEGLHHYQLLMEQGYISNHKLERDNKKLGLFYHMSGIDKESGHNLRLTSEGIAFAQALEEPTVYEKLKGFSQAPLSVLKDVGVDVFKAFLKQKIGIE